MPAPSGMPWIHSTASRADETQAVLVAPSSKSSATPKLFIPPGSAPTQTA